MTDHNRIVGHELFLYWDDLPSRRPRLLTREEALQQAKAFARAVGG